jgi:hypothetical protein
MRRHPTTSRYSKKKNKSGRNRNVKFSIGLIMIGIMAIVGFFIYRFLTSPPIIELNEEPRVSKEVWMAFLPRDSLHFRILNFTEISKTDEGFKLFKDKIVLQFANPPLNISANEVDWACEIELSESIIVNILLLNNESAQRFEKMLSPSCGLMYEEYLNVTIWNILSIYENQVFNSNLALLNNYLFYSGYSNVGIKKILTILLKNTYEFYEDQDIRLAYYLAVRNKNFLSLSLTKFTPMEELNISWQLSSLRYDGSELVKTDVYIMENQEHAIKSFFTTKKMFFVNADRAWITDKFIIAEFHYPVSELKTIIMGM